jgi:periplasmic divalent cation tolerance protein
MNHQMLTAVTFLTGLAADKLRWFFFASAGRKSSMEMLEVIAVYTTVATEEEAQRIAHEAVHRKLAACVQMESIRSVYEWQGKVHSDPEFRLLFKTTRAVFEPLRDLICSLHSYQLPAIFAVPVVAGLPDYIHWVSECVSQHQRLA